MSRYGLTGMRMLFVENQMLTEHTFAANGLTINYVAGPANGRPLLLLHGLMRRWQYMMPLIDALAADWQVFALDLRGHGLSDRAPGGYRHYQNYVPDVAAFLQTQIAEPAVLFGHSLGGLIALGAAARAPEQSQAVIAAESPLTPESILSTIKLGAWAWVPQLAGRPVDKLYALLRMLDRRAADAYLRETAHELHHVDPETVRYWAEDRMADLLVDYDIDLTLQRLARPLLLVQANVDNGGVTTDADVALAYKLHGDVTLACLPAADHELGLNTNQPQPLLSVVAPFLARFR